MKHTLSLLVAAGLAASAAASETVVVDFENGAEGWEGPQGIGGATTIETTGGNPGAHMHTVFDDFGVNFRNSSNPAFARDLSGYDSVTLSVDLKVEDISFLGLPYTRPFLVEIRDHDNVPAGYPWVSVWYHFDWVGAGDWTTWSVTIDDTAAIEPPAGWGGYGAEDPDTFEPMLPANRTFADVLAGADEIVYTTYEPGYFFSNAVFDMRLDNFTIETVGGGQLPGDANGDDVVDVSDLVAVIEAWGACDGACPADFDGNGVVDVNDLVVVITNWS